MGPLDRGLSFLPSLIVKFLYLSLVVKGHLSLDYRVNVLKDVFTIPFNLIGRLAILCANMSPHIFASGVVVFITVS